LRYIRQPLDRFHILVGPNASGKTTFLDIVSFVGLMISEGSSDAPVEKRSRNFHDLIWNREGNSFELALEAAIPDDLIQSKKAYDTIRYEVRIGQVPETGELGILEERVALKMWETEEPRQGLLFPMEPERPQSILAAKRPGQQVVVSKSLHGNVNFYAEVREDSGGKGWVPSFRLTVQRSALSNLIEDETKFPAATWLKRFLSESIEAFVLNSLTIRKASAPGQGKGFKTDGSNLPWVIEDLRKSKRQFAEWLQHLRTALPDLEDVQTVEREDDKHRYIKMCYKSGMEVPSWMVSDGTLRLLALTLPAYLNGRLRGVYLIEEPENGIHPGAVETLFQSLSSVYDAQILLATHSPVILSQATLDQVLCFKKTQAGATDIVRGSDHPQLKDWRGQPHLDVMFASGVLG
jgi:predicted ATPase